MRRQTLSERLGVLPAVDVCAKVAEFLIPEVFIVLDPPSSGPTIAAIGPAVPSAFEMVLHVEWRILSINADSALPAGSQKLGEWWRAVLGGRPSQDL